MGVAIPRRMCVGSACRRQCRQVAFGVELLAGATGLESWHMVEHIVIISNVVANDGCPCPGIGDRALGVSDTQLHFVYNAGAYAATVVPFWCLTGASERRMAAAAAS